MFRRVRKVILLATYMVRYSLGVECDVRTTAHYVGAVAVLASPTCIEAAQAGSWHLWLDTLRQEVNARNAPATKSRTYTRQLVGKK